MEQRKGTGESSRVVAEMTANGYSPRTISKVLDISTQQVYRHLKLLEMNPAPRRPVIRKVR